MPVITIPSPQKIKNEKLRDKFVKSGLLIEPKFRDELREIIKASEREEDKHLFALSAFSLAYSLDHYAPYDFNEAVVLLDKAIKLFNDWPHAWMNRGIVQIHRRSFDEAVSDLERAENLFQDWGSDKLVLRFPNDDWAKSAEFRLTLGKLRLFLAEALAERKQKNDLDQARNSIKRAEKILTETLTMARIWVMPVLASSVMFWLDQIPSRLEQTYPKSKVAKKIGSPSSFALGMVSAPLLLCLIFTFALKQPTLPADKPSSSKGNPAQSTGSENEAEADPVTPAPETSPVATPVEQDDISASEASPDADSAPYTEATTPPPDSPPPSSNP